MGVHHSQGVMPEPFGGCTDNLKAGIFPKGHGRHVGTDHNIELYTREPQFPAPLQGMGTEHFPKAPPLSPCMDHIAAVCDMVPQTGLIGLDDIGAQYMSMLHKDVSFHIRGEP